MTRFLGMTYQQTTWVAVGLILGAVEVFALARGDAPLTDAMRSGADRWMLWPALLGLFAGHFFGERGGPWYGPLLLAAAVAAVLYRDLFMRDPIPTSTHLGICVLFMGAGAWLWGSR